MSSLARRILKCLLYEQFSTSYHFLCKTLCCWCRTL